MKLTTEHLDLTAASTALLHADAESPQRLAALLGAQVGEEWPPGEYDAAARAFFLDRVRDGGAKAAGWWVWYGVERGDKARPAELIAAGGFFGPPGADGEVELGVSVMPAHRGKGRATEFVQALVAFAFRDPRVRRATARAAADNAASHAVLRRNGFFLVGEDAATGLVRFARMHCNEEEKA